MAHRDWTSSGSSAAVGTQSHLRAIVSAPRFGNFIETGLITAEEVRPYLAYWLTDLTTDQGKPDDAKWRCAVLTYMFVYEFQCAVTLFRACNFDVDPRGKLFRDLRERMRDDSLFEELQASAERTSRRLLAHAERVIRKQEDSSQLLLPEI